jgi:hypothetical protein
MADWQPIETAPKDGTEIILYRPSDEHRSAKRWISWWYDKTETQYGRITYEVHEWWGGTFLSDPERRPPEPTHWMPLPEPPVTGEP